MRCVGKAGPQLRAIHLDWDECQRMGATALMVMGPGLNEGLERTLRTASVEGLETLCEGLDVLVWWVRPEDHPQLKPPTIAAEDAGEGLSSRLQHLDAVTWSAHAAEV